MKRVGTVLGDGCMEAGPGNEKGWSPCAGTQAEGCC